MCILVYRPPKPSKDFIKEFTDFFDFIASYNRLLILGDFNIHVCCPDKPLVKDFCRVIDLFGLVQHINQPTHTLGYTLDLILSYGFSVDDVLVDESSISDQTLCLWVNPQVAFLVTLILSLPAISLNVSWVMMRLGPFLLQMSFLAA